MGGIVFSLNLAAVLKVNDLTAILQVVPAIILEYHTIEIRRDFSLFFYMIYFAKIYNGNQGMVNRGIQLK